MDSFRETATEIIELMRQEQKLQAGNTPTAQQWETSTKHTQATHTESIQKKDACIVQLREKNTNLERHLVELNKKCRTAQEGALQAMEKGGWAAKQDSVVRDELAILQDRLRSWAREYSMEALNPDFESVSDDQKDKFVKELEGYCLQTNWCSLLEQMPKSLKKVPPVLVQALLTKDIFQNIFTDPFFAFPETVGDPKLPDRAGMQLLYRTMIQCKSPMVRKVSLRLTIS